MFLLVGTVFMSSAYVQAGRGHIGIEAFVGLLSPTVNRIRLWLVDVASLLFCAFFAWKSWTRAHDAWVDGEVSNSMWSPPLSIPYGLMAIGMTLLCVQILLQVVMPLMRARRADDRAGDSESVTAGHPVCDVFGNADRVRAGRGRRGVHGHLHAARLARHRDRERLRGNGHDHAAGDPAVHPQGSRHRPLARRPDSTRRCMPGCIGCRAGSASPMCLPARCSPPWPDPRRPPARRSALPAFRRCARAATRRASPPA